MELIPVYVLHTRPFRNTSLLVELLSEQLGRISVVARNARGPKSRYRGQLQLFTPLLASWFGQRELKTLGNIELNGMPFRLNQQPLFCAFYLNELLMRVLHREDPHPQLFRDYQQALCQLENDYSKEVVLRQFEKRLLDALGYGLPFTRESQTGEIIKENALYIYDSGNGFLRVNNNSLHPVVFSGSDLLTIAAEDFHSEVLLLQAKRLFRMALLPLLGNRPLSSRCLFE